MNQLDQFSADNRHAFHGWLRAQEADRHIIDNNTTN